MHFCVKCIFQKCIFQKCIFQKCIFQKCIFPKVYFAKWYKWISIAPWCFFATVAFMKKIFAAKVYFSKVYFSKMYFPICTLLACLLSFASLFLFHSFLALLYKLRTMTRELRTWWCLIPSSHHEPARVKQENLTNKPTFMNQQFSAKWFSSKYSQWASP